MQNVVAIEISCRSHIFNSLIVVDCEGLSLGIKPLAVGLSIDML